MFLKNPARLSVSLHFTTNSAHLGGNVASFQVLVKFGENGLLCLFTINIRSLEKEKEAQQLKHTTGTTCREETDVNVL